MTTHPLHATTSSSARRGGRIIARAFAFLLYVPLLPMVLLAAWRARRRLRLYGPPAILALHDLPRLRSR
jgi:hypothetical protein